MKHVYVLQHSYEDSDHEDVKLIGVYSSRKLTKMAISSLVKSPGFKQWPDGFHIGKHELDKTNWREGFSYDA